VSAWLERLLRDPDAVYRDVVLGALAALVLVLVLRAFAARRDTAPTGGFSRVMRLTLLLAVLAAAGAAYGAVLRSEMLHGWLLFAHVLAGGAIVALLPFYALTSSARSFSGAFALLCGLAAIAPVLLAMQPLFDTAWQHRLLTLHRYAALLFLVALALARRPRAAARGAAPGAASHR
jgi:hypothetical protein